MKLGQEAYTLCAGCHTPTGQGLPPAFPPLAGSEWVLGPKENIIKMMFRGLQGPIEVKGQEYNGVMAPNVAMLQTDEKIAAVLTFIRNSWGNEASAVTVEEVAALRSEVGQPMLLADELIDPKSVKKEAAAPAAEAAEAPAVAETQEVIEVPAAPLSAVKEFENDSIFGGSMFALWVVICIIPVLIGAGRNKK